MKKAFFKHHFSVVIFAFLLLHSFLVSGGAKPWSNDVVTYAYHAVDFSMGFCTRILPGAIYKLFVGKWNMQAVNIFDSVLMILFFAVLAVFCEKLMKSVGKEDRRAFLVVMLFFLTGPCSFPMYIIELGMMDMWWLFIAAVAVFLLSTEQLFPLIVPLGVLCVVIHYAAICNFVPLIVLLILYKCAVEQNRKKKAALFTVGVLTAAAAVAATLYFLAYEKTNLVYSIDEFHGILASRGVTFFGYYDYDFYNYAPEVQSHLVGEAAPAEPLSVFRQVVQQISFNAELLELPSKLPVVVLMIPAVALLFGFVFSAVKKQSDKTVKTVLLLAPVYFVASLCAGMMFSADVVRFLGHSFLGLFTFVMFVIYNDKKTKTPESGINGDKYYAAYFTRVFRRIPQKWTAVYVIMYVLTVWEPYRM